MKLFREYRRIYDESLDSMSASMDEKPWHCSPMFVFGIMDMFIERLEHIKHIVDVKVTYTVLRRIRISGFEKFEENLTSAYEQIASKPYSALDHREKTFDQDYAIWNGQVEAAELGMQTFVKEQIQPIQNVDALLLLLKRFDRLQLDCLCMDRRYLDVAIMLEKEMERLKDVFNEKRANPPVSRCSPPIAGRIMWVRSLGKRIGGPMAILKSKPCVIVHRRAQLAVKYYNFLSEMFLHYEMQHHKAWYDYVDEIRRKFAEPVLRKNRDTNWLEVNFHPSIHQLVRETEAMEKLDLDISTFCKTVAMYKDIVFNAQVAITQLVARNNAFRMSIDMILLNISRPLLRKLELAFKPGLSTVLWNSEHLDVFIEDVSTVG